MSWKPLDKIYIENVSLYTKTGNDYELVANVDQKYYDDILSRYVKMGSIDSIEGRNKIEERLEKAGGNIGNNLDIFQSYTYAANFDLNDNNFTSAQTDFLNLMNNSATFSLDTFIQSSFHNSDVYNQYFDKAWCALPEAPTHGAPGCGELYLAFVCDGVKPKKGDLSVGGKEIELKGAGGRLFKTPALQNDFSDIQASASNNDGFLVNISKFVAKFCGIPNGHSEILKLIKENGLESDFLREREYILQKGKLRPGSGKLGTNLITQVGGTFQLFEYKKAQGFDVFLAYNQVGNDLVLQAVNMENLTDLSDFYKQLNNLKGILKFSRRTDGKGWSCTLTGTK
tara:strand:- start:2276 stop:3298 length:1023 start_codon:yes stop_codon:yes gene_type:complete